MGREMNRFMKRQSGNSLINQVIKKPRIMLQMQKEADKAFNQNIDYSLEIMETYLDLINKFGSKLLTLVSSYNHKNESLMDYHVPVNTVIEARTYIRSRLEFYDEQSLIEIAEQDISSSMEYDKLCQLILDYFMIVAYLSKDVSHIVSGLCQLLPPKPILETIYLPNTLAKFNIDLTKYSVDKTDFFDLNNLLSKSKSEFQRNALNMYKIVANKSVNVCDILIEEVNNVVRSIRDNVIGLMPENKTEDDEHTEEDLDVLSNLIGTLVDEKSNEETTEYTYIDSYRELNKLAENKGYVQIRNNGDHGIFSNNKGEVIIIPQGRSIGKGLSFRIQKALDIQRQ